VQLEYGNQDMPVRRLLNDNDLGVDLSQEMADTEPERREYYRRAPSPTNLQILKNPTQKNLNHPKTTE
jgi:hypothetical protein